MGAFFLGSELQARLTGWLIVGAVRLVVSIIRGWWWLATRHPLIFAAGVVAVFGHGWSREPRDRAVVMGVVLVLGVWGLAHALAGRPRWRRLRELLGDVLERRDVQQRVVARVPDRRARAAADEMLRAWSRTRRRGGRWRDIPADYLARPDVQAWVCARVTEGHSRGAVAEALRIWTGSRRRGRRWEMQELRRLGREAARSRTTTR